MCEVFAPGRAAGFLGEAGAGRNKSSTATSISEKTLSQLIQGTEQTDVMYRGLFLSTPNFPTHRSLPPDAHWPIVALASG